jgi:hypothetical protein
MFLPHRYRTRLAGWIETGLKPDKPPNIGAENLRGAVSEAIRKQDNIFGHGALIPHIS